MTVHSVCVGTGDDCYNLSAHGNIDYMSALRPRVSRKADLLAMIADIDTLANSLATLHFNTI